MKPIYRIVKHTYYKKCDEMESYYTVEERAKFLWFKWWSSISETECGTYECGKTPITFKTESDALQAINKIENGNIVDGWISEVATVIDFNKKG